MPSLTLTGAREHTLQSVDLRLPLGHWIAVVGPSGSGKSSLVIDTLVREGQRRFLGALSARARHALGKLGRADVDALTGLPATIAVGQRALTAHARSTVGTLTGGLDLLRLLYARQAVDPGGVDLSRSHFSFNHPLGACPACKGVGVQDHVDPELLVADASRTLRQGALKPTLKSGYTVYSQVTVDVMDQICRAHGFDVDTPWASLTDAQRSVVLYGTRALKVPFGKHSIESRMRWEGITARPREEGYYRGIVPVIEETLARSRNDNILRFVRSIPCQVCAGARLDRPGRDARIGGVSLPELVALPTRALPDALRGLPESPVLGAVRPSLMARLARMDQLGLGHLSLDRTSTTLSGGEGQRVRLAAQLSAELTGQLIALDEPTLGLHPERQAGMAQVLDELRGLGNTLVVVEHDPDMVRRADHLVVMGPGAGPQGGQVVYAGPLEQGPGGAHPLGRPPQPKRVPRVATGQLLLRGATLHTLQSADLTVQLGVFNVVTGPSGAGKTSLVFGTLVPALQGTRGGPFTALDGAGGLTVRSVDASPIGRTPRSTPATWSGLFDGVRKRFAATDAARALGFKAGRFSYNNKAGRCPGCEGLGVQRVGLHLLQDVELTCPVCQGARYAPEVLRVTLRGHSVAQVLQLSFRQALALFADDPPLARLCQAMVDLGLGYLQLGQSSTTLSRGEAQRVKLATLIGGSGGPALLVMDEPDRGLHPADIARLLRAIDALVDAGHTVLAISHHRHVWAAADHRVALRDGTVVPAQPLSDQPLSPLRAPRPPADVPAEIRLTGVRTQSLQGVDVRIPHGALTVVVGPSGSGKTSLVFDTLAATAWSRFAESLPFQVRRFMRRMPRPTLESATGLTPTLALRQRQTRAGRRSTVATQSELGPLLRLIWSRIGTLDGAPHGLTAEHFSADRTLGACPDCQGLGTVPRCDPARLVTHPERSLLDGALSGTKPGRFLGEPDGQYLATLRAVLPHVDWSQPWRELSDHARSVALDGAGDQRVSVTWSFQRGKRSGEHTFEGTWDGLCALAEREARLRAQRKNGAAWTAVLQDVACPSCAGRRLSAPARDVRVQGRTLPQLLALPVSHVAAALEGARGPRQQAVLDAVGVRERLDDLCAVGLGHLSLDRRSPTLSDGELQRLRLVSVLRSGLTGTTVVLDEPSAGLHGGAVATLVQRLRALCAQGNTVVVVDHRPALVHAADHLIELGPGAGPQGGQVVAQGPRARVLAGESATARALRQPVTPSARPIGALGLRIRGAHVHTLHDVDLDLPTSGVVAVVGPSGSGKSSLVFGVIEASMRAQGPVGCASIQGLERFSELRVPRAAARGPLDALRLLAPVQGLFHSVGSGVPKRAFSFRSPAGRCPACKGTGLETVSLDFLSDLQLPCPVCAGQRFRPQVLEVRWQGLTVHEFLCQPASQLRSHVPVGPLTRGIDALIRVGLGHLSLGRHARSLSGGEAQRVALAESLLHGAPGALHLLDEPARGLHEQDLAHLVDLLRDLADRGDLVIATAHRASVQAAADWVVELGPAGGPDGGRVVRSQPVSPG